MKHQTLHSRVVQLRETYTHRLPGKIAQIEKIWEILRSHSWDQELFDAIHGIVHGLAGSGKTFGYSRLSKTARTLEELLEDGFLHPHQRSIKFYENVQALLHLLREQSRQPDQEYGAPAHSIGNGIDHHRNFNRVIAMVDEDEDFAIDLAMQLEHFDLAVHTFATGAELEEGVKIIRPGAIIINTHLTDTDGTSLVKRLRPAISDNTIILFISSRDDIHTRLKAIRGGGDAYLLKPFESAHIVNRIDELTACTQEDPYRIMIVDDSRTMAQLFSLTLEHAGMRTCIVTDPTELLNELTRFHPELILMDMYMPQCSGDELAKVVRQHDVYFSIPIVFLSAETDFDKQLAALSTGGDDFLTKPIQPDHLVLAVTSRMQRTRLLHNLIVRDGLTGLFNHTETKRQLDIQLEQARRTKTPLSYAMLDIDHFKHVNDNYGHPVGDRVLKALAHFLRQRLRKSDTVGRYGGEEFAVILPDTDQENAQRVIEELRQKFSLIIHHSTEEGSFRCTFSCGIASYPQFDHAIKLVDMADKSLYQAKDNGRNQTVVATPE